MIVYILNFRNVSQIFDVEVYHVLNYTQFEELLS